MGVTRVDLPIFTETEMANLFAFIYSVRSMDEPGDPERGRRLLFSKGCSECHAISGRGRGIGPDLRDWASYRNPVSWIQAMWNHAPVMQELMDARGLPWPRIRVTTFICGQPTLPPAGPSSVRKGAPTATVSAALRGQERPIWGSVSYPEPSGSLPA
jgi:cytochrome c2